MYTTRKHDRGHGFKSIRTALITELGCAERGCGCVFSGEPRCAPLVQKEIFRSTQCHPLSD